MRRRHWIFLSAAAVLAAVLVRHGSAQSQAFTYKKVMVPVRDGIKLETVIMAPADQSGPLPILFRRTPYGVPASAQGMPSDSVKALAKDGYIFVVQNLRGRFQSEGTFELTSKADLENPKATSETTDAYDSIEWMLKNVPNNSGKVGMFGVSYDGLTSAMTLLRPHPALKAISQQASPADQWMNDDDHRYGALRESYAFEYAVLEQADKNANTNFQFETYDTYQWYLDLGPLSNINAKYLHGKIPYWNSVVEHPDYDKFWKDEAWVTQIQGAFVPNLNVAGFWDQEDPWGPWEIYRRSETSDLNKYNFIVAGPWFHGQWHTPKAESIGLIPFGGHDTAVEFRERIEAPWFRYLAPCKGRQISVGSVHVPDGIELVEDLREVAAAARDDETVFAGEWLVDVRCAQGRRVRSVHFRSGASRAVPPATDLTDVSGWRLAAMGSRRPAIRGRAPGRGDVGRRTSDDGSHGDRRARRDVVRVHVRNGQ